MTQVKDMTPEDRCEALAELGWFDALPEGARKIVEANLKKSQADGEAPGGGLSSLWFDVECIYDEEDHTNLLNDFAKGTFGVFQPGRESAKQAFQRFLDTGRVHSMHRPEYGDNGELGAMLRAAVSTAASRIVVDSARAV